MLRLLGSSIGLLRKLRALGLTQEMIDKVNGDSWLARSLITQLTQQLAAEPDRNFEADPFDGHTVRIQPTPAWESITASLSVRSCPKLNAGPVWEHTRTVPIEVRVNDDTVHFDISEKWGAIAVGVAARAEDGAVLIRVSTNERCCIHGRVSVDANNWTHLDGPWHIIAVSRKEYRLSYSLSGKPDDQLTLLVTLDGVMRTVSRGLRMRRVYGRTVEYEICP